MAKGASNAEIVQPMPLRFIPDLQYGEADGKPLLLDIFAPQEKGETPRPARIWIHGFGWFAGTHRDNLDVSMSAFFTAHRFVVVSIEYRLSDEATFPAQLHDVKGALTSSVWLCISSILHLRAQPTPPWLPDPT